MLQKNTEIALNLLESFNTWNATLPYPDYIGENIYKNGYDCTSVADCQPILDPNYESYNLKVYYFESTTANKTIDVKINGDMFADDFVLGSGNGGCFKNKDSVVKTIENILFNITSSNTIRLYNSPAIEKICIEYIQPLSQANNNDDLKINSRYLNEGINFVTIRNNKKIDN